MPGQKLTSALVRPSNSENTMNTSTTPFNNLTPDLVLDAVEHLGLRSDARIYPLNSYENRVYQVGIEDDQPIIAKFYRPQRWTNEQIIEEHQYSIELAEADIPVVPPSVYNNATLLEYKNYRFALYVRRGGHAPELDNLDNLFTLGQTLGRIHAFGSSSPFALRPDLTAQQFGHNSRDFLLNNNFLPSAMLEAYSTVSAHCLEKVDAHFENTRYKSIKLHGDCHAGNILWRDEKPNFVDLDDARNGPAMQDLWMLLSGDRIRKTEQLMSVIEGYETFCEFNLNELKLLESLRTLRLMHYAAWLAKRWQDPAFPTHFPWFNTERYWADHVNELREQMFALDEAPLKLTPY